MKIQELFLLCLLLGTPAMANTVIIGGTEFPLGEEAFPNDSQCLDPTGCGSEDYIVHDFTHPLFPPVSPAKALRGHRLDLVALDLDNLDEMRLGFPVPIINQIGNDIYIAQAVFRGELWDPEGINTVEIRFGNSTLWHAVNFSQFFKDDHLSSQRVTYSDPELKQVSYILWFTSIDLSNYGLLQGETVNEVFIRGIVNAGASGFDAAVIGNLNQLSCNGDFDGDGVVGKQDLGLFAADFGRTGCP